MPNVPQSIVPQSVRDRAAREGAYRPDHEHDSCGVGFIAHIKGERSHALISQALTILENLEHRGAEGSDPLTGDGAGILVQIPHELLAAECRKADIDLPARAGAYGLASSTAATRSSG